MRSLLHVRNRRIRSADNNGFSLVEMMVAICVVSVAIVAVLESIMSSVAVYSVLERKKLALSYLSDAFEEMSLKVVQEEGASDFNETKTLVLQGKEFTYTVESEDMATDTDMPLVAVRGSVSWKRNQTSRSVDLFTVFKKKQF